MTAVQIKARENGHAPIDTLNGAFVEAPPQAPRHVPADEFLAGLHKSTITGVDWPRVVRDLIYPDDEFRRSLMQRWADLGRAEDVLPSRTWYAAGCIGNAGCISVKAARRDLAWLEAVEAEARLIGLQLGGPADGMGEHITVTATCKLALKLGDEWVTWSKSDD